MSLFGYGLKDGFDNLAHIVSLGHGIIVDGRDTVSQQVTALAYAPFDANLIGAVGTLSLREHGDEFLWNVNMEGTGQQVYLTL